MVANASACVSCVFRLRNTRNERNARNAALALHVLRALRMFRKRKRKKRKRLRWQPWLAASIEHSYWLAFAFVAWKIESVLALRCLTQWPLASVAWLALAYFCFRLRNFLAFIAFLAHFLFCLRIFFLRKTLRALRAFELKPGMTRTQFGKRAFWVASSSSSSLFAWKK